MKHRQLIVLYASVIGALFAGLCMTSAAATTGALALGFVRADGRLERVSISALAQAPAAPKGNQTAWTMHALDAHGASLWRWSLPAPRRFHPAADGRSEFVLVVPEVAPGTLLRLHDQQSRLLWSELIGVRELDLAHERGDALLARVASARAATAALAERPVVAALERQLHAQERRGPAPAAVDVSMAAAPAEPEPTLLAGPNAPEDVPRAADSVDLDAAQALPQRVISGGDVLVSVVDENGVVPTTPFPANLFHDGNYVGVVQFDNQGQALLPLVNGSSYELDFLPAAPLVAVRRNFDYNGTPPAPFVLEIGWLLDVFLHDSNDQAIPGAHSAILFGVQGVNARLFPLTLGAAPGQLRFAVPKQATFSHYLDVTPASIDHVRFGYQIGNLEGSEALTLNLRTAAPIPGQVVAADGGALPPGGSISCWSTASEISYSSSATFATDGSFVLRTPLELAAICLIIAPSPMLDSSLTRTFHAGDSLNLSLLRGVSVRFIVHDENGQVIANGVSGQWADAPSQTRASCFSNPCELLVPEDRAVRMEIRFSPADFAPIDLPLQQYVANSEHIVVAHALHSVTGQVLNADALVDQHTRVRVFDAEGRFVVSQRGPTFDFRLSGGSYRFEADANLSFNWPDSPWTFRNTVSSGVIAVGGNVTLPDLVLPSARGDIEIVVDRACGFDDRSVHVKFTAPDGRRFERMMRQDDDVPVPPRPPGQCASVHTLGLSPGHYLIEVAPLGWPPQTINTTVLDGQTQQHALNFAIGARTRVWRGTLVDAQQEPVTIAAFFIDDAEQTHVSIANVDNLGRFEMPFVPGWSVKAWVFTPDTSRAIGAVRRFGASPPGPVWTLDRLDLPAIPDAGLVRIHGDGDRERRRNIVFISEGYTNVNESYSDVNFNGQWDGVLWDDLNGDGVYDWSDRVWMYGSAPLPQVGQVPTASNEPFVDVNGDGVLSLDDPAMFLSDARVFMRSLLSSDVWSEHRDSFNAWVMFVPSNQAGYDVVSASGQVLVERDTHYGASLPLPHLVLNVDRTAMAEDALAALPEVDVVVALVNEPLPGSRANATTGSPGVIVVQGGLPNNDSNNTTQSHEMGHFVANLCDEYTINATMHPLYGSVDQDLGCANATLEVDADRVPWQDLLPKPPRNWPTLDHDGTLGLFEGAGYYASGAYRPTRDSTMNTARPFFNTPSRRAIEAAIIAHTQAADILFRSGFE